MAVKDSKIEKSAITPRKRVKSALVPVISKTNRPFDVIRPGHRFRITRADGYTIDETGTVTAIPVILDQTAGLISAPVISKNAGAAAKFDLTTFVGRADGIFVEKGAAAANVFSDAHVVTANCYGAVLVQMSSAGAISTKVVGTPQAFGSAAAAIGSLPAADAGNVALGYILVQAKVAADWTANASDLTPTSGLQAVTFVSGTAAPAALSAAIAFADGACVDGDLSDAIDGKETDDIVWTYTSDGTGALVNGSTEIEFRPVPLQGEY